jgi:uncharacterized protein YhaN
VLVTVPRQELRRTLNSLDLLQRAWPDHAQEVMTLVHVLRISRPSLADALKTGLLSLESGGHGRLGRVHLAHRSAELTALALADGGTEVERPHERAHEVTWLEVEQVAVHVDADS